MIALPIISVILWLSYIIFVLCKFGIPVTISETYYLLSKKWDWLFAVWCFFTATPFCIYWYIIAPVGLKWFAVANWVAMISIGICGCYKSGPKEPNSEKCIAKGNEETTDLLEEEHPIAVIKQHLIDKFKPSALFKYGWKKLAHYVNAVGAIVLSTVYFWITAKITVIASLIVYCLSILFGSRVEAVYNSKYSSSHSHNAWIFFAEITCFLQLFLFILI